VCATATATLIDDPLSTFTTVDLAPAIAALQLARVAEAFLSLLPTRCMQCMCVCAHTYMYVCICDI